MEMIKRQYITYVHTIPFKRHSTIKRSFPQKQRKKNLSQTTLAQTSVHPTDPLCCDTSHEPTNQKQIFHSSYKYFLLEKIKN